MMKLEWHNEKRVVKDLTLFEGNPRTMSEKQANDLMKSLSKFNIVELPVIDQKNRIIAGNMRITALKTLGRGDEEIEVRVPNRDLTEEEAREYLLRSNKNTGDWNLDLLVNFDEDLLLDVGWEQPELDFIFQTDETMFIPNLKPEIDTSKVTKEMIEKRAKELVEQMYKEKIMEEVICPECGHEFLIEGAK